MTNGEYIEKIVEQDKDFCIFKDYNAETVTIDVSLDWWNKPKTDVLDKIRAEIEHMIPCSKEALSIKLGVLEIINKYKKSEGEA